MSKVLRIDVAIDKAALYEWAIHDLDEEQAEQEMAIYCEVGQRLIQEAYPEAEVEVWLSLQQGPDRITVDMLDQDDIGGEDEVKLDVRDCMERIPANWPEEA